MKIDTRVCSIDTCGKAYNAKEHHACPLCGNTGYRGTRSDLVGLANQLPRTSWTDEKKQAYLAKLEEGIDACEQPAATPEAQHRYKQLRTLNASRKESHKARRVDPVWVKSRFAELKIELQDDKPPAEKLPNERLYAIIEAESITRGKKIGTEHIRKIVTAR